MADSKINMFGYVWASEKTNDGINFKFQIDGIKRGVYTKVIDPTFKGWKEVGSGYNYKKGTEIIIFSKPFPSDIEMIKWVKEKVEFPTTYNKCDTRCTAKVLVKDKNEVGDGKPRKTRASKNS